MAIIKRQKFEVPINEVTGIDKMFGQMMKIDLENIPRKFVKNFELTKQIAYDRFTMFCLFESFEIESMDADAISLKNGTVLESTLLPNIFHKSKELGFFVASLRGYDEADAAEDNILRKLFLDNWGTAFIERGDKWAMQFIAKALESDCLYVTNSFSPGQNDIPIEMQSALFELLDPSEINVRLSEKYMMYPKKSVSGIFGIQTEKDESSVRPCDLCERRDTCPTAYA